ncbi:MAG: magnesium transporter, partial [Chromatiales bacterium]
MTEPALNPKAEYLLQALSEGIEGGTVQQVRRMLNALHPAEIAHLLESLPPARRELVWELVDPENDGEVLVHLGDEARASLVREMETGELLAALEGLDVDDLADFIQG